MDLSPSTKKDNNRCPWMRLIVYANWLELTALNSYSIRMDLDANFGIDKLLETKSRGLSRCSACYWDTHFTADFQRESLGVNFDMCKLSNTHCRDMQFYRKSMRVFIFGIGLTNRGRAFASCS